MEIEGTNLDSIGTGTTTEIEILIIGGTTKGNTATTTTKTATINNQGPVSKPDINIGDLVLV